MLSRFKQKERIFIGKVKEIMSDVYKYSQPDDETAAKESTAQIVRWAIGKALSWDCKMIIAPVDDREWPSTRANPFHL